MYGQDPYEPDEDGLYDFSEDQIQAMLELDLLQREAIDCQDDVQARLEEVNRALADDPTPLESSRKITVAFKSEIVDLVVPPDEIPSDDEYEAEIEHEASNSGVSQDEDSDEETARLDAQECDRASLSRKIYERELAIEEADKDLLDDSPSLSTDSSSVDQTTINFSLDNEERNGQKNESHNGNTDIEKEKKKTRVGLQRNKANNFKPSLSSKGDEENSHSTFGSTSDISNVRRKKAQNKKEEEKGRKEAADLAFQSWLRHKRQKAREQRRREKKEKEEKKKNKEPPPDNSSALKDYWKRKRREARQKQKESERQNEELQRLEELRIRNQQEVELAYQRWVKMKKQQARLAQDEEQRRQMITKLSLRNSRRSQALALALNTAGSFVDYYGYR